MEREKLERIADSLAEARNVPGKRGPKFKNPEEKRTNRVCASFSNDELREILDASGGESVAVAIRRLALEAARGRR